VDLEGMFNREQIRSSRKDRLVLYLHAPTKEQLMEKAGTHQKSFQPAWIVKKKISYEWIVVAIASTVGFAIVITLIAYFELSSAK
jgi:hypothetical protein